jgi:hypothetical protein
MAASLRAHPAFLQRRHVPRNPPFGKLSFHHSPLPPLIDEIDQRKRTGLSAKEQWKIANLSVFPYVPIHYTLIIAHQNSVGIKADFENSKGIFRWKT